MPNEKPPACIPFRTFKTVLDELHRHIGVASGISDPTRNLLLGYIEGYMSEHAFVELTAYQEEARELIYAAERAHRIAQMTNMSIDQRKDRMRKELLCLKKEPNGRE